MENRCWFINSSSQISLSLSSVLLAPRALCIAGVLTQLYPLHWKTYFFHVYFCCRCCCCVFCMTKANKRRKKIRKARFPLQRCLYFHLNLVGCVFGMVDGERMRECIQRPYFQIKHNDDNHLKQDFLLCCQIFAIGFCIFSLTLSAVQFSSLTICLTCFSLFSCLFSTFVRMRLVYPNIAMCMAFVAINRDKS